MPELPEVETIKQALISKIKNKKITNLNLYVQKALRTPFNLNNLINETIINIHRKGKHMVVETNEYWCCLHLRMEGKIFYFNEKPLNLKHSIIFIKFDKGYLDFKDHRKFATIDIFSKNEYLEWRNIPLIQRIANEPWDINEKDFIEIVKKRKTNIKNVLLNQKIISGLGNIYVNETLYRSGISPFTIASHLSKNDIKKILNISKKVLEEAIKMKGTTISTYKFDPTTTGQYQKELTVHKKKKCPKNHPIKFDKISGRGTFWCPICQKEK